MGLTLREVLVVGFWFLWGVHVLRRKFIIRYVKPREVGLRLLLLESRPNKVGIKLRNWSNQIANWETTPSL